MSQIRGGPACEQAEIHFEESNAIFDIGTDRIFFGWVHMDTGS